MRAFSFDPVESVQLLHELRVRERHSKAVRELACLTPLFIAQVLLRLVAHGEYCRRSALQDDWEEYTDELVCNERARVAGTDTETFRVIQKVAKLTGFRLELYCAPLGRARPRGGL